MTAAQPCSTKRRRPWLFALLAAVALAGAGAWSIPEVILPRLLVIPHRVSVDHGETPGRYGIPFDAFNVVTAEGFVLKGWFVHAMNGDGDKPAAGTVVVLHGHSSCKEHMLVLARLLTPHGYNVIVYDSRGHGESGGTYATFGAKEKGDVSRYLDAAQQRFGELGPVAVIGTSFGSAVAIQAMAGDRRFCCGIVCSPFPNLEETARQELKNLVHFDSPWLLRRALEKGGRQAGFRVADINPEQTARSVRCPVLVIHGEKDERFPVAWAQRVYAGFPSPQKEWLLAKGNTHDDVFWFHDATNVKRAILLFLTKNAKSQPASP